MVSWGKAEYFYPGTVNDKTATFITKRKGDPKEHSYTFTMEQAKTAGLLNNPVHKTHPSRMLSARAKSYLAETFSLTLSAASCPPKRRRRPRSGG